MNQKTPSEALLQESATLDQSLKPQPTGEDENHRPAPGGTKLGKKPKTEKLKKENSGEFEGVEVKLPP